MIDDTNSTNSYSRFHTREMRTAINTLSPDQKLKLLDEIQLQKAAHDLTAREYDRDNYKCIETLLKKESP